MLIHLSILLYAVFHVDVLYEIEHIILWIDRWIFEEPVLMENWGDEVAKYFESTIQ